MRVFSMFRMFSYEFICYVKKFIYAFKYKVNILYLIRIIRLKNNNHNFRYFCVTFKLTVLITYDRVD